MIWTVTNKKQSMNTIELIQIYTKSKFRLQIISSFKETFYQICQNNLFVI